MHLSSELRLVEMQKMAFSVAPPSNSGSISSFQFLSKFFLSDMYNAIVAFSTGFWLILAFKSCFGVVSSYSSLEWTH